MSLSVVFLLICFSAGLVLGGLYFAGLWWTVRRLPDSRRPGLLALASFLLRASVVLAVFYTLMNGRWHNLGASLCGFMVVRWLLTRRIGTRAATGPDTG
jgi:F1F0 ATPase subunit 2